MNHLIGPISPGYVPGYIILENSALKKLTLSLLHVEATLFRPLIKLILAHIIINVPDKNF